FERTFAYTDEGQLVGHLVIGVEMLNEKAAKVPDLTGEPFPKELLLRLKHLILSHHGTYEFGSPKLPMTPEAIALHHLDNFDAMDDLAARILAALSDGEYQPLKPKALARKLGVPASQYNEFRQTLRDLIRQGKLAKPKGKGVRPGRGPDTVTGVFRKTGSGLG